VIGETVAGPRGLRALGDPSAYGQADHYDRRFTGGEDNGGVHVNAGIAALAFYLAVEGGVHPTSGVAVAGLGPARRDVIDRVFYRAFVFLLPSDATFAMARRATIQAARDEFGPASDVESAVAEAWTAVGVR
jgi:thermolysin